jgi:hypothetical protein
LVIRDPGKEEGMEVKGTVVMDWVKIVQDNPERDWKRYLKDEDWKIIRDNVLPSAWYPYEFFHRLGYAMFKEMAQGNLEAVRGFGKVNIRNTLQVYRGVLVPGDPVRSAENFAQLRRNFMRGDADTRMIGHGAGWLKYLVVAPSIDRDAESLRAFCYQIAGNLEGIVEDCGFQPAGIEVHSDAAQGEIMVRWK